MKIAIYTENGSLNSRPVFSALIEHLKSKGEEVYINQDNDCDVAIIWSVLWMGRMSKNKKIWDGFRKRNKPVVVIEVGGLKRNITWKIAINGINRDADFANDVFDDKRWPLFGITMQPWRDTGNNIVILGQHDKSNQWQGKSPMPNWVEEQINEIRKYSQRPILVRPHPRNLFKFDAKKYENVFVGQPQMDSETYDDTDFKKILKDAWTVINYSSNPAIESVINGVPVFVSESSLCYDVGNKELSNIENPSRPDRKNWANKMAYTEWTVQEIKEGLPWKRIRDRLEERYIKV